LLECFSLIAEQKAQLQHVLKSKSHPQQYWAWLVVLLMGDLRLEQREVDWQDLGCPESQQIILASIQGHSSLVHRLCEDKFWGQYKWVDLCLDERELYFTNRNWSGFESSEFTTEKTKDIENIMTKLAMLFTYHNVVYPGQFDASEFTLAYLQLLQFSHLVFSTQYQQLAEFYQEYLQLCSGPGNRF
jgi:hypothetical protein